MAFQGDDRTISIPELFNFIVHQRMEGLLVVASASQERCFGFRNGELEYALLNDPGQLLGEVLIRELSLDPREIGGVLYSLGEGQFLGEELVARGIVSPENLEAVVRRQIRRALREVLRWNRWAFHFCDSIRRDEPPTRVKATTQSLVLDLTREMDEWERVGEVFFDLDCVPHRMQESVQSRKPEGWDPNLPGPGKLLLDVDGHRTVRDILEESPHSVYSLACAFAQMIADGLIELLPSFDNLSNNEADTYELPAVPDIASGVLELVSSEEFDLDRTSSLILSDPILAARTLRLASIRGSNGESRSFSDEVRHMGRLPLQTMLLAESARRFLSSHSHSWHRIWQQSYLTSLAAEEIVAEIGGVEAEEARVAGLLHNLGAFGLAASDPERYRKIAHDSKGRGIDAAIKAQVEEFGTDQCRVGAAIADKWGFPATLKTVLREHHSNLEHPKNRLLSIVRLAMRVADPESETIQWDRLHRRIAKQLKISPACCERIRSRVRTEEDHARVVGVLA